jgi:hypothetical protein
VWGIQFAHLGLACDKLNAMKSPNSKLLGALLVLIALFSACAGPPENDSSSNANATQQANSNSSQQVAQNTPQPPPLTLQPMPPPAPTNATAKPAVTPATEPNANTPAAANPHAPKLVAPDKKLDFGKQPQDKTLIRAIPIRNAGREVLKIESVAPS